MSEKNSNLLPSEIAKIDTEFNEMLGDVQKELAQKGYLNGKGEVICTRGTIGALERLERLKKRTMH